MPFTNCEHSLISQTPNESHDADHGHAAGDLLQLEIADVNVDLKWIPGSVQVNNGQELKYCPENSESQRGLSLIQGFWLAGYLATLTLWFKVMANSHCRFDSFDLPAVHVDWRDAQKFLNTLNANYRGELPSGFQFAIPTLAQWQSACRVWTSSRVTRFITEPWSVFDLVDPLWEWTVELNASDDSYVEEEISRLFSGEWSESADFCRSAYRFYYFGIRLALVSSSASV